MGTARRDAIADIFLCVCILIAGILIGARVVEMHHNADGHLPRCQEDEYLFPIDYLGPGKNVPGDYRCVPVDVIIESNAR